MLMPAIALLHNMMKIQPSRKRVQSASLQAFADEDSSDEEGQGGRPAHEAEALELKVKGQAAAELGDLSQALTCFEQALRQGCPDPHQLYELRAQVLMQLGKDFEAIQAASKATSMAPHWWPGFLTLGRAQLNYGEPRLALVSLQRVLQLQPENVDAKEELAVVQMLALQQEQAGSGRRAVVGAVHTPDTDARDGHPMDEGACKSKT